MKGLAQVLSGAQGASLRVRASVAGGRLALLNEEQAMAAEEYRLMAGRLCRKHPDGGVFLVTSAAPADGKTLTATNLAFALAERHPALLLELDLRKPSLRHVLEAEPAGGGIASVLLEGASPESAVAAVEGTELSVCFARGAVHETRQALGGRGLRSLLEWGREHFHWVVLDTPPVLPVADVSEIAPLADFAVLVVRARRTPEPLLRRALETLRGRVSYTILNDGQSTPDHFYKYAQSYLPAAPRR